MLPPINTGDPPPLPWLATDEQPFAKKANFYYFANFFQAFLKIFSIFFLFLSPQGVKEHPLGFDNSLLNCFQG